MFAYAGTAARLCRNSRRFGIFRVPSRILIWFTQPAQRHPLSTPKLPANYHTSNTTSLSFPPSPARRPHTTTPSLRSDIDTMSSSNSRITRGLMQPMPKFTREYIDRLAAEISRRDGIITDKDVWGAYRYLKLTVQQVRVRALPSTFLPYSF
jgi:hypothetical protein